ncbi:cell wall-binding repeat-containing protein, partial [Mobiluncus mulieris]
MKWATSITTIATTLALTLTPTQAIAGGQAANNTVGEAIDTLKASLVNVLGGQAGLSDQSVKEITNRPFIRESAGSDRYHTAWKIARSVFKNEFNPQGRVMKKIYVASGDNPADALAASNLKDG